jgi:uncharacterized protein HemX
MVRLLVIALIAAAGWYAWKMLKRQQARVEAALRKAEATAKPTVREQKSIALEKDPKTGVYRPSDRQD